MMLTSTIYPKPHEAEDSLPGQSFLRVFSPFHRHGKLSLGLVIYFWLQREKQAAGIQHPWPLMFVIKG